MLDCFVQKIKMGNAPRFIVGGRYPPCCGCSVKFGGRKMQHAPLLVLTRNALAMAYGFKPTTWREGVRIVPCSTSTNKPNLSGYRFAVQANK